MSTPVLYVLGPKLLSRPGMMLARVNGSLYESTAFLLNSHLCIKKDKVVHLDLTACSFSGGESTNGNYRVCRLRTRRQSRYSISWGIVIATYLCTEWWHHSNNTTYSKQVPNNKRIVPCRRKETGVNWSTLSEDLQRPTEITSAKNT